MVATASLLMSSVSPVVGANAWKKSKNCGPFGTLFTLTEKAAASRRAVSSDAGIRQRIISGMFGAGLWTM